MIDYVACLKEFHKLFEHTLNDKPTLIDWKDVALRKRLMEEELEETTDAMLRGDLVEIADGLADLLYVVFGTAETYGIPIDGVFSLVHDANMRKLVNGKCLRDTGGKTIKPPGWVSPNQKIKELLEHPANKKKEQKTIDSCAKCNSVNLWRSEDVNKFHDVHVSCSFCYSNWWENKVLSQVGWKPTLEENSNFTCRKCGSENVWYCQSEGDFEDTNYRCHGCGRDWWVEGADS